MTDGEGRALTNARPTTLTDATAKQLDGVTVPREADAVTTRHARRIALHHRLVRRRRWSKELDALLIPSDPWARSCPLCGCGRTECTDAPDTPRCDGGWHAGPPCTHFHGETDDH
jgi:hypothetical protein